MTIKSISFQPAEFYSPKGPKEELWDTEMCQHLLHRTKGYIRGDSTGNNKYLLTFVWQPIKGKSAEERSAI